MNRLFTLGCSFTYYGSMVTYPWFMAKNFDESYNLGLPGVGNEYIYHSLIDADTYFKLTPDDTVIILWTGFFRLDMPRQLPIDMNDNLIWEGNGDWSHYNADLSQIKKFYSEDFMIHKTYNYMVMAKRFLEAKNINYRFASIYDLRFDNKLKKEIYDDKFIEQNGLVKYVIEYNQPRLSKLLPVFSGHPSFSTQYKFAQKFSESLGMILPDEVDEWKQIEDNIYIEQNVYDNNESIMKHKLYEDVSHNCVSDWKHNTAHTIFPNCIKFHKNSSNLYKQILLDVFA